MTEVSAQPVLHTTQKLDVVEEPRAQKPCAQCPWRLANQGKRHAFGFYTLKNLRRLWKEVRGGSRAQSCHLTDASHVAVGAKPGAKAKECPGSVVMVVRELRSLEKIQAEHGGVAVKVYLKERRRGLTRYGLAYWAMTRVGFANVPFMNPDGPLPLVDDDDPEIGLPESLR